MMRRALWEGLVAGAAGVAVMTHRHAGAGPPPGKEAHARR